MKNYIYYDAPFGRLTLISEDEYLTGLYFGEREIDGEMQETEILKDASTQLDEYFAGNRRKFELPLRTTGTDFQRKCWEGLRTIPYGETRTYQEMARYAGNEKAVRAVGGANHNNPISIIVPCHRVIGKNGKLVGFGGGLDVKEFLLNLENENSKSE